MTEIPIGFCQCGCGRRTPIAKYSRRSSQIKGQPYRFIHGHNRLPFEPNRIDRFDDFIIIWLERRNGSVLACFIDTADYDLVKGYRWSAARPPNKRTFYARTRTGGKGNISIHEVIFGSKNPDHIDGDGLNNRRSNLRQATASQQIQHQAKQRGNYTSQFKGVCFVKEKGRWKAVIECNGKRIWLGYFDTEIEAAKAYNDAALKYFGEFAVLNDLGDTDLPMVSH